MGQVIRCTINSPTEFLAFWNEHGPFNFLLAAFEVTDEENLMETNECIFSNSLPALIKEYLQWDQRGMYMDWEPPTEQDIKEGIHGSWYAKNLPDYYDYVDWHDPGEDASPLEAERLFIIDFVDTFTDSTPSYENFSLPNYRQGFLVYLEDWQKELSGSPLNFDGFQWPPEPDTAPREGAPYGICPRCEAPRIKEATHGHSGLWEWEEGFLDPLYWRWQIHCPRVTHTAAIFWDDNSPPHTQEEIN